MFAQSNSHLRITGEGKSLREDDSAPEFGKDAGIERKEFVDVKVLWGKRISKSLSRIKSLSEYKRDR
jgi:hypothetical protein